MDVLFPTVNAKRKEVVIEMEYVSVSEEELEEEKYYNIIWISKTDEKIEIIFWNLFLFFIFLT